MNNSRIIAHKWLDADKFEPNHRIEEAVAFGATIIERDVRETADGQFLISHDSSPLELGLKIEEATSEEIICKIGREKFERMSLKVLLGCLMKTELKLNLEIKNPALNVERLVELIPPNFKPKLIISSFYPSVLRKVANLGIVERWLIISISYRRNPLHLLFILFPCLMAKFSKATGIAPNHRLISKCLIRKSIRKNLKIVSWTVNLPGDINKNVRNGVWGIVTDNPKLVNEIVSGKK